MECYSRHVTRGIFWKNVLGIILKLNLRSSCVKRVKATGTGFRGKYSYLMFLNLQISEKGFVVGFRMGMCLSIKT